MDSKVSSCLFKSFINLLLALAVAGVLMTLSPAAFAQSSPTCFQYANGQFKATGGNAWREIHNGSPTYSFVFQSNDGQYVYVFDQSRNLTLSLPVSGGWSRIRYGSGSWSNGYQVQPCAGSTIPGTGAPPNPIASAVCVACRNRCVQTRVQCLAGVCQSHGGTSNGPNACTSITRNTDTFASDLAQCHDADTSCQTQQCASACQ
jgi:hypothetical protein